MSAHFITTAPRPERCRCGRLVLTGHAEGFSYRVEADPVNHRGEVSAVLDGHDTYESHDSTNERRIIQKNESLATRTVILTYRDSRRMENSADSTAVFVAHRCARRIPPTHRSTHLPPAVHALIHHPERTETDDQPPF